MRRLRQWLHRRKMPVEERVYSDLYDAYYYRITPKPKRGEGWPAYQLDGTVIFIFHAMAAGVIGNLAYDLIKAWIVRHLANVARLERREVTTVERVVLETDYEKQRRRVNRTKTGVTTLDETTKERLTVTYERTLKHRVDLLEKVARERESKGD